jgi:tetratricopeptide (TPR) repeat protein
LAAERCKNAEDPKTQERRRRYLRAATSLAPENAVMQLDLAEAYHDAFEREEEKLALQDRMGQAMEGVGGIACNLLGNPAPPYLTWTTDLVARAALAPQAQAKARKDYLQPALRYFIRARNLCPLLGRPHVRLATYAATMARADSKDEYLRRAVRLLPTNENIWLECGATALKEKRYSDAWSCWRRSLECSPHYLKLILDQSSPPLKAGELAEKVLPADPMLVYQAALLMGERPDSTDAQKTLLEAALRLFEHQEGTPSIEGQYTWARCHRLLGQTKEALQVYREVVVRAPEKTGWCLELCQLLIETGQLREAERELGFLLQREPGNTPARDLLRTVQLKKAAGE